MFIYYIKQNRNPNLEWNQMSGLWSNMQALSFGQCTGLTMTMILDLIAPSSKLRSIDLPMSIVLQDVALFYQMRNQIKERVDINVYNPIISRTCPFQ